VNKRIVIKLSEDSISKAIREVEKYKGELKNKVHLLIEKLTDYGVEVAKAQVRELGAFYTGELESSIKGYFSPSVGVGIIKAGAPYAVYVEFGTGIVGKSQPHPSPDDWRYDINEHGESGWWYFNDYTGHPQWTKGMPSRPFMYNTARELENACERIAREVFGR
jgi:HK97 gp10 family phage protein